MRTCRRMYVDWDSLKPSQIKRVAQRVGVLSRALNGKASARELINLVSQSSQSSPLWDKIHSDVDSYRKRQYASLGNSQSSEKPAKKAKMAKGHQMHAGYVTKRWKTRRAAKPGKYLKYGAVTKVEIGRNVPGGSGADRGVVYSGHGLALDRLGTTVWKAVIRRLYMKAGHQLTSWQSAAFGNDKALSNPPTATTTSVNIFYKVGSFEEQTQQSHTVLTSDTFLSVAVAIHNFVLTAYGSLASDEMLLFTKIVLNEDAKETSLNLSGASIDWMFKSSMYVQNRTAPAETANGTQADRVDANPIHGYCYEGYGNGFRLYNEGGNVAPGAVFDLTATRDYGLVQFNLSSIQKTQEKNLFLRPPATKNAFVGTKKMTRVILQPGQMRRGYITYRKKMGLDNLAKMESRARGTKSKFPLGKCQLFGFDKVCRSGVEADVVEIGLEINQVYCASLFLKNPVCLPDIEVAP